MSSLALNATLILYNGSPFHPEPTHLIDLINAKDISIFGNNAKFITTLKKTNIKPRESHKLHNLKTILSTNSPLAHENFEYIYHDLKANLYLSSISNNTDIISYFTLNNPTHLS